MKQYNIFQALYMSFYSKALYRDVAANWGGITFLYLLMVLFLTWIIPVYQVQFLLNEGYRNNAHKMVTQIPVLTIKDSKLSTPESRPYFILDPETNEKVMVIDTTGEYTTLEQAKTSLLVTEDAIISQSNANEMKTYKIPNNLNMVIDPEAVSGYVQEYLHFAWLPLFFLFLLGSYVYRIIQSLFYALIGMIFASMNRVSLTYGQLVQLAMIALSPVIIIATFFDIFNVTFPFKGLFYFVLAMAYLWYGIVANKVKVS